jgi:integrase
VRDFNFDAGVLIVHGKGTKDRAVPLPESIVEELKTQIKRVVAVHAKDLAEGYDGVFLDDRTIQTKLGHSSLKTTMIYTHCVPVRTIKEAKSPLDL